MKRPVVTPRKLSRRARRRRRGVAFILVLGALTILSVMMSEIQDESSAEFSSAMTARDELVAEYAARSAVNLTRLLLATEPTIRKALTPILMLAFRGDRPQIPVWEFADRMLGPFNDASGKDAFTSFSGLDLTQGKNLGLPGASFDIVIVDEDSKINVNAAARPTTFAQQRVMQQLMALMAGPQYNPLFERRDADGNFSDRQTICSAIIDWVDPDQNTMLCDPRAINAQEMPAEDSYYELMKKPYHRKNAGLDSLLELRRVRGMSDDFWATFVDPDPDNPKKRLMTVWGTSNAININTAGPEQLYALVCNAAVPNTRLCMDINEQAKFITAVLMMRTFTMGAPPFGSPQAFINTLQGKGMIGPLLQMLGLEPIQLQSPQDAQNQMTVESKMFSIYATGTVKSGKRETHSRIHAVIDFRNAPPPTAAPPMGGNGGMGGTAGTTGTFPPPSNGGGGTGGTSGFVRPNPAGNVIYFRLD